MTSWPAYFLIQILKRNEVQVNLIENMIIKSTAGFFLCVFRKCLTNKFALILIFFFPVVNSFSQNYTLSGKVISSSEQTGLPGATVRVEGASGKSSGSTKGRVTDIEGNFLIRNLDSGKYVVVVQFIGLESHTRNVEISDGNLDLGIISLEEETTTLQEVTVIGKIPVGEQKSDTSEFNAAAFKVLPDASAQDLIEKMPGIARIEGRIQAQGEDVQQILIDGKPFFGGDVEAALNSLPADAIANIQVFDQKSDKTILSGFDDGERTKTINIITKPNRKKGIFGKATAGYGTDERYLLGSSVNFFSDHRRITVTGLSNNVNTMSYSADPNNEGQTRTQNGIISTHSIGTNFIDSWNDKIDFSGSYNYTHRENIGEEYKIRDYVLPSDSGQIYTEKNNNLTKNGEHRIDIRFDYKINDRNKLIIQPRVSLKDNSLSSLFSGNTFTNESPVNRTENASTSENLDYNYHNRMYFSHKFAKEGRSLNLRANTSYHTDVDDAYRRANNVFFGEDVSIEVLDQYTKLNRIGFNWEGEISYTEPLSKYSLIEIEYEIGNRFNDSDKRTYDYSEQSGMYSLMDTSISNTFESQYLTQEAELGYQFRKNKLNLQLEAEYQNAKLMNDQFFPADFQMDRVFHSILPSARLDYKFSKNKNLEINYRTWTNEPSVGQLQNVIDNSNPLQLRTGNPDLDQSYNNWIRGQYRAQNPERNKTFYASLQSNFVRDYIANSTLIAEEPTFINDDLTLETGSQLTRPVNVEGFYNLRSYFSYGQPWEVLRSNINLNSSVNYSRRPGLINDQVNFANSYNFRLGVSISSNISETLDFNISTRSSYNLVENTLRPALDNNFFNQSTRLRLNWVVWEGFVFRTDFNHEINAGLTGGFNPGFALWNMSIGKKVFKNQLGEISIMVYDLLEQNNNVRRNINELFIEDIQSNVLQKYFMLTFTYNIRSFSKGTTVEDYEKLMGN